MICLNNFMEKFRPNPEVPHEQPAREPEMVYHALDRRKEKDVLATFTPEQQAEIKHKQQKIRNDIVL